MIESNDKYNGIYYCSEAVNVTIARAYYHNFQLGRDGIYSLANTTAN